MNIYTQEHISNLHKEHFAFLEVEENENVLTIRLARENRKNALHPQMLNEIAFAMQYAYFTKSIWAVVLEAKGNIFCAGGDLKAMAGIIEPHDSTIPEPKKPLLFHDLFSTLHKPLIAKVTGDVYAGGFMFLAGATFVIASDNIKLALPEVKRGIFPMQVMAALLNVMPARKVIDWCVRGYQLPVQKAFEYGLVTEVCKPNMVDTAIQNILNELRQN
jgi:methylglutaconyl-CoA hydratase